MGFLRPELTRTLLAEQSEMWIHSDFRIQPPEIQGCYLQAKYPDSTCCQTPHPILRQVLLAQPQNSPGTHRVSTVTTVIPASVSSRLGHFSGLLLVFPWYP